MYAHPMDLQVLIHPRVVRLFDVFEIDANSFATVLEICRGTDLDRYLKQNTTLSEREARSIVIQVLSALRYLSGGGDDADRRGPRVSGWPGTATLQRCYDALARFAPSPPRLPFRLFTMI